MEEVVVAHRHVTERVLEQRAKVRGEAGVFDLLEKLGLVRTLERPPVEQQRE